MVEKFEKVVVSFNADENKNNDEVVITIKGISETGKVDFDVESKSERDAKKIHHSLAEYFCSILEASTITIVNIEEQSCADTHNDTIDELVDKLKKANNNQIGEA